jgi:hypothetical protein
MNARTAMKKLGLKINMAAVMKLIIVNSKERSFS